MAKNSWIVKAAPAGKVFEVRNVNRCKVCGRSRALHAEVRHVPHLLPRDGVTGTSPWRDQVELVIGWLGDREIPMSVNDPISDMLTRIRNAGMARKPEVSCPRPRCLSQLRRCSRTRDTSANLRLSIRRRRTSLRSRFAMGPTRSTHPRDPARQQAGSAGLCRAKTRFRGSRADWASRSSARPQGVLTGYEARRRGIGGEVLCTVF